jgi:predicted RNA-binding Zn-ribbon protein involved in translation (DUF1610 family)
MLYEYKQRCEYIKKKDNWVTGCAFRVKPNKYYTYCPYCGKFIIWLSNKPS